MKRLLVSALPADPVRGVRGSGSFQVTRRPNRVRPRTRLASGFVLLVLAFSGCGGEADTATDEVAPEEPGTTEQSGYEEGYQTAYIACEGFTPSQVAKEFSGSSEKPRAAAEGFADSYEPDQRKGAYEGCYDALLKKPPKVR